MKLIGARWTPQINILEIECKCGNIFEHRSDHWRVRCESCGQRGHLNPIRDALREETMT